MNDTNSRPHLGLSPNFQRFIPFVAFEVDAVRCKGCGSTYMRITHDPGDAALEGSIEHHLMRCASSGEYINRYFYKQKEVDPMLELWFVHIPGLREQRYLPHSTRAAAEAAAADYARERPGQRIYIFQARWVASCESTNVVWRAEPVTP